ncbi:MAG: hypothetical protein ACTHLW_19750 [Verrucomicrobiota bacterium]
MEKPALCVARLLVSLFFLIKAGAPLGVAQGKPMADVLPGFGDPPEKDGFLNSSRSDVHEPQLNPMEELPLYDLRIDHPAEVRMNLLAVVVKLRSDLNKSRPAVWAFGFTAMTDNGSR